ncbi:MAG TPA: hypothetical protein VMH35_26555 [Streptosporangiaceae bacterium]|nr:hypothetical protein [Streptosporangiaceae bacterium]
MSIHSLGNASRPGGSHRRARAAGIGRARALPGILVLLLAVAAGLAAVAAARPGHTTRPVQAAARQHAGHPARSAGFTAVTVKSAPKMFMY